MAGGGWLTPVRADEQERFLSPLRGLYFFYCFLYRGLTPPAMRSFGPSGLIFNPFGVGYAGGEGGYQDKSGKKEKMDSGSSPE